MGKNTTDFLELNMYILNKSGIRFIFKNVFSISAKS